MRYLVTIGEYSIVGIVQAGIDQPAILEANLTDMLEKVVYEYENNLLDITESIMSRFKEVISQTYDLVDDINDEWFDAMVHLDYPLFNKELKDHLHKLIQKK
jgi:hypothetical protein